MNTVSPVSPDDFIAMVVSVERYMKRRLKAVEGGHYRWDDLYREAFAASMDRLQVTIDLMASLPDRTDSTRREQ
jgi:hypothetical protein